MPSRHILIFTYTTLLTIRLQTTTKNPRGILACWSEQYPDGKDGEVLDENVSPNFSDVAFTSNASVNICTTCTRGFLYQLLT